MITKLLTLGAFFAAQFLITWYGYYMGGISSKGSFLGLEYESAFISLLITQLKFIWVPIIINLLYGFGFQSGNEGFSSFLVVISLWIAAAPLAAITLNLTRAGERIDLPIIIGLILIVTGAIIVVSHKEISKFIA